MKDILLLFFALGGLGLLVHLLLRAQRKHGREWADSVAQSSQCISSVMQYYTKHEDISFPLFLMSPKRMIVCGTF